MEEGEIDEWFNEQKERLEERFYAEAQKDTAAAKARFDKDYRKLIQDFQAKHDALYTHQVRMAELHKPITRMQERWRLSVERRKQQYVQAKLAVKKWLFDQKVKRILRSR